MVPKWATREALAGALHTCGYPILVHADPNIMYGFCEEDPAFALSEWIREQVALDQGIGWLHECVEGERWTPGLRCGVCGKGVL